MKSYREKINYLNQYFYATKSLEVRKRELQRIEDLAINISSVSDGMPHQHNGTSKVENGVAAIADLKASILEDMKMLEQIKEEVSDTIYGVENYRHRMILEMRYIGFMPFGQIAKEIRKSENNVYKIHKRAIERIEI